MQNYFIPSGCWRCCFPLPKSWLLRYYSSLLRANQATDNIVLTAKYRKATFTWGRPIVASKLQLLDVEAAACRRRNLSAIELDLLQVVGAVHPSRIPLKKKRWPVGGNRKWFVIQWQENAPADPVTDSMSRFSNLGWVAFIYVKGD